MNLNIITAEDATRIAAATRVTETPPSEIAKQGTTRKAGKVPQVTEDDLYTRILKFIPVPLIGLYLFIVNGVLGTIKEKDHHDARRIVVWLVFIGFGALIAIYLHNSGVHRKMQIAISLIAYGAWATASAGPFQLISGWNDGFASLIAAGVVAIAFAFKVKPLPSDVIDNIKP
jgi:hypothetical protein